MSVITRKLPSQPRTLIIGAGIVGLAVAHGLKKAGKSFTIFEAQTPSLYYDHARDWNMSLHWGIPILKELLPDTLAHRLDKIASVNPQVDAIANRTMTIVDSKNSKILRQALFDEPFMRISRAQLRALVGEDLDIRFGHALSSIDYKNDDTTVTANFANGMSEDGTLVVGADGNRSIVRQHLFGAEGSMPTYLNGTYISNVFSYHNAAKTEHVLGLNPCAASAVHPECKVSISLHSMPDPKKPETWTVQMSVVWKGTPDFRTTNEQRHEEVRSKVVNICEPFHSAVNWIPREVELWYGELSSWAPNPFDTRNGRVVLAGDSAHSLPPFRGQGLQNGLLDAQNLVAAIQQQDDNLQEQGAELIQEYSDEVVERGKRETDLSVETAHKTLGYDDFEASATMKLGLRPTF